MHHATLLAALPLIAAAAAPVPEGPLERLDPRIYDLRYEVTINTAVPYGLDDPRVQRDPENTDPRHVPFGEPMRLVDAPIVMPIVFEGAYHTVDRRSVTGRLWLGDHADPGLADRFRIDDGLPYGTHLAVLPIVTFEGRTVRWNVSYRVQAFSSRIDDDEAARIRWPRQWPPEAADGLKPQQFVESDDPVFAETVARVTEGKLRLVPPYLAAKDLVRYCVNELPVSGDGQAGGRLGVNHGMRMVGARQAVKDGTARPHDLVCVCVAMLKAAGIPARPVIGVQEGRLGRKEFVTWGELFLPGAGWIPFDPDAMRGKGIRHRDVRTAWPEFGTMDDLNRRIPLAYHFIPPRAVQSPQNPAVWGWDPRPGGTPDAEQRITINIVSRGSGSSEPQ